MKKTLALVLIAAVVLIFLTRNKGDDEFFTNYFNEMVQAGESKNVEQFMNFFSLKYKDDYSFNYIVIKNIVKNTFNEFDRLEGSFSDLTSKIVKSDGRNLAVVNMDARAIGIKNGIDAAVLGLNDKPENITVYLEKSTLGKWKIIKVEGVRKREY